MGMPRKYKLYKLHFQIHGKVTVTRPQNCGTGKYQKLKNIVKKLKNAHYSSHITIL